MSQKVILLMTVVLGSSMAIAESTAQYSMRDDEAIQVVNRCCNGRLEGTYRSILSRLPEMGHDPAKLNRAAQPETDPNARGPE